MNSEFWIYNTLDYEQVFCVFQFWFAIMSGFSGQIVFERWSIALYNVVSIAFYLLNVAFYPVKDC